VAAQAADNACELLDGDALLPGDLNNPPDAQPIQDLKAAGWRDLWAELHPGKDGFTFESSRPRLRIDYAFASPALFSRVQSIEIVANSAGHASDHFGLLVTL
jgi:endonuclease/exonuclease/phosphatase family metal-dependent hydrolase